MTQSILSLSELKADASRLVERIREEPGTLVLTQNGRARAVVEDHEQYQARARALFTLRLMAQGERDIAEDRLCDREQVFAGTRKRLLGGRHRRGQHRERAVRAGSA